MRRPFVWTWCTRSLWVASTKTGCCPSFFFCLFFICPSGIDDVRSLSKQGDSSATMAGCYTTHNFGLVLHPWPLPCTLFMEGDSQEVRQQGCFEPWAMATAAAAATWVTDSTWHFWSLTYDPWVQWANHSLPCIHGEIINELCVVTAECCFLVWFRIVLTCCKFRWLGCAGHKAPSASHWTSTVLLQLRGPLSPLLASFHLTYIGIYITSGGT